MLAWSWFFRTVEEEQCRRLATPSTTQFVVSCGLMGWILLCYVPQWARIVARKSTEGISTYYILLGALSGVCAVGNIIMLPSTAVQIGCCRSDAQLSCISHLLGMFQVIFSISCYWIVLCMYAYYSKDQAKAEVSQSSPTLDGARGVFRSIDLDKWILSISNGFALLILIISAVVLHHFPGFSQTWANTLGISLAIGACIQWLPQVVTTWNLGHLGSLSPTSLCFLAPYNWIFGISMIVRLGIQGWSAWIVYVLVGTMQAALIGFAVAFWLQEQKEEQVSVIIGVPVCIETTCLSEEEKSPLEHPKSRAIGETSPLLGDDR